MPKLGTLFLKGKSGTSYPFVVYSLDSNFSKIPAVYVVTDRHKNEESYSHNIIYIGQTDNLKERFENHHKQNCFDKHNANVLCIHQESSEKKRLTIETDLIEVKNAPCNG